MLSINFFDLSTFSEKQYNDQWEEEMRRHIFETNVKHIREHNIKYTNGEKSYYLGVNQFTDLVS